MTSHTTRVETFTLRLPRELRQAVNELAHRNERSPGAEIRYALRRHIDNVTTGRGHSADGRSTNATN